MAGIRGSTGTTETTVTEETLGGTGTDAAAADHPTAATETTK